MAKNPSKKRSPNPGKYPRSKDPDSSEKEIISWHFNAIDLEGDWDCSDIKKELLIDNILNRIKSFETMHWSALPSSGSHQVSVGLISSSARTRLTEIGQDDIDDLYSLRIDGKARIWGIRDRHIFRLLWWDPNHSVCPSTKRHT